MILYQGKKEQIIKSVGQTVRRLWPNNIKLKVLLLVTNLVHVSISRTKLSLNKHDVTYPVTCPETTRNDKQITEAKQQIKELKT